MTEPGPRKRVLIVEDSPVMRGLLRAALSLWKDVTVIEAPDGAAALKEIRAGSEPFAFILLDINLPILDGMKLLGYLKTEGLARQTTICVVTTEGSAETEQQARSLGATHFVRKPTSVTKLREILREALG